MLRVAALVGLLAMSSAPLVEGVEVGPSTQSDHVTSEQFIIYVPVTNRNTERLSMIGVECEVYDGKRRFMSVATGYASNVGPGQRVMARALYEGKIWPGSVRCRASFADR